MSHLRSLTAALAVSGALLGGAVLAPAQADAPADGRGLAQEANAQLAAVKKQMRRLSTPEQAMQAGYVPASPCVTGPGGAGMGEHYVNFSLMGQPLDPMRPQALLFVPDGDGGTTLGGVEWLQPDADQDLSTTDDRPSMFGRGFDGPMPGHGPGEPVHYDLHVWLFTANPDGVFAPFNPRVTC